MPSNHYLENSSCEMVLDVGALVNLKASGFFTAILAAFPTKFLTTEKAWDEFAGGEQALFSDMDDCNHAFAKGLISVIALGEIGQGHFLDLVSGPSAESLDDSEAETVACALEQDAIIIVDDPKVKKLCSSRFPDLKQVKIADLLFHKVLAKKLGGETVSKAVLNAHQQGGMHVPEHRSAHAMEAAGKNFG